MRTVGKDGKEKEKPREWASAETAVAVRVFPQVSREHPQPWHVETWESVGHWAVIDASGGVVATCQDPQVAACILALPDILDQDLSPVKLG